MRYRTFHADTVQAALLAAQAELGPEALLMSAKPSPPAKAHLGNFEVTCGTQFKSLLATMTGPAPTANVADTPSPASASWEPYERLAMDVHALRSMVTRLALPADGAPREGKPTDVRRFLDASGFAPDIACSLADLVAATAAGNPIRCLKPPTPGEQLKDALTRRLDAQTRRRPTPRQRLLILVGPSGAGRTSLGAKLATRILLTGNRVRLISADGAIPGAPQKLQALATIIGCDHQTVEDPEELTGLTTDRAPDMLTIVDCPSTVVQALSRWSSVLSRLTAPEIHLVVNATAKPLDIRSAIRRHAPLRPHRLACTHLDETSTFGSVLGESIQAELPVSFVSHGTAIPEDLAVPEIGQLLDLAFPDLALYGPHPEEQTP